MCAINLNSRDNEHLSPKTYLNRAHANTRNLISPSMSHRNSFHSNGNAKKSISFDLFLHSYGDMVCQI